MSRKIVWLEPDEIRAIHLELIAEYGGSAVVRDTGLLESALHRPRQQAHYRHSSLFELAAAYGFGLAKNHPFVDGNKRIALAALAVFLELNGYELIAAQDDAVATILGLAAGEISESELAVWVKANSRKKRLQSI